MKNKILLILLVLFVIPHCGISTEEHYESSNWRADLAILVAQLIPDDAIRSRLLSNQYIIMRYAEEPAHWNNTQSHTKYLLDNILCNYYALIDAMNQNNWTLIAMRYAVLGHYIGDCADPFNVNENISVDHLTIYEEFIDMWAEDIFGDILEKSSTLELEETDNITKTVNDLIVKAREKYKSIIVAIDRNDTALLLNYVEYLAEEATKSLYAITISAIKNSELATSMRVLERWRWVAIAMIFLSLIIILASELKKKILRRL